MINKMVHRKLIGWVISKSIRLHGVIVISSAVKGKTDDDLPRSVPRAAGPLMPQEISCRGQQGHGCPLDHAE